jgi:DNA repair protein RadA/Sms
MYESLAFEEAHGPILDLLPATPGRVLDVGAGSGRDAAWFAYRGHAVVAVEPSDNMRRQARERHADPRIRWIDDALPGLTTFLIGHVTKDGAIAGPRLLEHMVDTVLYFEGERGHSFRILRAVKNRFGSTNEIGVFEMKEAGLAEVSNPSEIFLMERPLQVPGSAVVCSIEGTRPILVELQALVCRSFLAVPRRTTIGVDHNRVALLVAVLEKKMGAKLFDQDIFVNVAGGVHVDEPAVDLGVIAAISSSSREAALDPKTVFFGEVGLAGEVRGISQAETRVKEAGKLGFERCILPASNVAQLKHINHPKLVAVSSIQECWKLLF